MPPPDEDVLVVTALQLIGSQPADQQVAALLAPQRVLARAALEMVVAGAALEDGRQGAEVLVQGDLVIAIPAQNDHLADPGIFLRELGG